MDTPEDMVVSLALRSRDSYRDLEHLTPDDFEDTELADIWATVQSLDSNGAPHHRAAVAAKLPQAKARLDDLAYTAATHGSEGFYAEQVAQEAVRRRIIETVDRSRQLTLEATTDDIPGVIDHLRAAIDATATSQTEVKGVTAGEYLDEYLAGIGQVVTKYPTPWDDLDWKIGGWRPGAFYVIAARTGVGKTIAGLQSAVGMQEHGKVLFCSLEMGRREVMNRIVAQVASVPVKEFEQSLSDIHRARIDTSRERLSRLNLHIDDREQTNPAKIRSLARSLQRQGPLAGIVVDYLQLMTPQRGDKRTRYEVLTDFSRSLKMLARELDVPVIAMAQLNRGPTQRADDAPKISDIRESGAIEQDADVILLLHQSADRPEEMQVGVGKNRHGPTGAFKLAFEGQYTRLSNIQWAPTGGTS